MERQEQVAKLKKQITLFTIFKFVGLGLLILGAILFVFDMVDYVKELLDVMSAGDDMGIINAFFKAVMKGTGSMYLFLIGLAALIVFSILGKKRKSAYALLMVEIADNATVVE